MSLKTDVAVAIVAGLALAGFATYATAEPSTVKGTVTDVFGERFVVDTAGSKALVMIGPRGRSAVAVKAGDTVSITGDLTPAGEIIARQVAVGTGSPVMIDMPSPKGGPAGKAPNGKGAALAPDDVRNVVTKAGYEMVGEPQPKRNHVDVLAKKDGAFVELRVGRAGDVREKRTVTATDPRWGSLVR